MEKKNGGLENVGVTRIREKHFEEEESSTYL